MREKWKPSSEWQFDYDPGCPYQSRLILGRWQASVMTEPQNQGYVWAVKRKAWLGDWQHDGGFAPSLEEAMYASETSLERVSGLTVR
jgi:hypothetical protein